MLMGLASQFTLFAQFKGSKPGERAVSSQMRVAADRVTDFRGSMVSLKPQSSELYLMAGTNTGERDV